MVGSFLWVVPAPCQEELPDKPDLIRVTVDHPTGGVLVQWEASTDPEIDYYYMYQMEEGTGTLLYKFSPNTLEYLDLNHGLENLAYTVTAVDTMDGTTSRESLLGENVHRAVSVNLEFDPCETANVIRWTGYEGWEGSISGYKIFRSSAGQDSLLKFVHANTREYLHREVRLDTDYAYYVETVHTSGMTSLSPIDTVATYLPRAPDYLTVDWVSVMDRQTVELQFSADPGGPVNSFRVMRREGSGGPYTEVETFWNTSQSTHMLLDPVNTRIASFQYKVQALYQPDDCTSPLVIAESNPGNTILLSGSLESQVVHLTWTPYQDFPGGLAGYTVQRNKGDGEYVELQTVSPGTTTWSEPIEMVLNGFQPGQLEYRIMATGYPHGETGTPVSISNPVGVAVETHLQLPSAFTPGSNDINYEFKPLIDFAPREYILIIFDRGGRKLFETSDPGEGWTGTSSSGGTVMEGVYVYFIQYTDHTGITRSFTGNVTVIHP